MNPIRNSRGFTFLEIMVALTIALFAVSGISTILVTDLKQLNWVEEQNQLFTYIPESFTNVITTEITSTALPSGSLRKVKLPPDNYHAEENLHSVIAYASE